jgi:hypothetical protein
MSFICFVLYYGFPQFTILIFTLKIPVLFILLARELPPSFSFSINTYTHSSTKVKQDISTPNHQSTQLTNAVNMSFNKLFALTTLAVLVLAGFASPAAINPSPNNANIIARQDDASFMSVDAFVAESDVKYGQVDHVKLDNLTTFMARQRTDPAQAVITASPNIGDVSINSSLHQPHATKVVVPTTDKKP